MGKDIGFTHRCDTCKFSLVKEGIPLRCRRFPPSVANGSEFPVVSDDGWCGEYTRSCDIEKLNLAYTSKLGGFKND